MFNKERVAVFIGNRECFDVNREHLQIELIRLIEKGVDTFLSGGMGQFDAICEGTVNRLKLKYPQIRLFIIMPYVNFKPKHNTVVDEMIFPDGFELYHPKAAIQKRNRYMVDHANYAVCYVRYSWGGAAQTLNYAQKQGIQCVHILNKDLCLDNR